MSMEQMKTKATKIMIYMAIFTIAVMFISFILLAIR